jgi:putative transposase
MKEKDFDLPEGFFKQFKSGAELQGFLDSLFKRGVQEILQAEMDEHLGYTKHSSEGIGTGNSRNGKSSKTIKTKSGRLNIEVPRDRNSSFKPVLVPKRKRMIDQIEDVVISFYAKGMSTRDIRDQMKEIYGLELSESSVSNITERILVDVQEWQSRPLDDTYLITWLDGITFKVRSQGKIINKSVYIIIGLNTQGRKEVLGMWINNNETAGGWLQILNEIKQRGVQDILIACTDNLKGLSQAIKAVFPQTVTQLCIVHQIRNSFKYVSYKNRRDLMKDLRAVYGAINLDQAQKAMNTFQLKWENKYPNVVKSWLNNWDELTAFFDFPKELRTIIYTTNVIENLNRNIRKFTKNKVMFPDDDAVIKAVYLAIQNLTRLWNQTIKEWPLIANQFIIKFPDRCKINIITLRS